MFLVVSCMLRGVAEDDWQSSADWVRIARYVLERRNALGLTQAETKTSAATWTKIENAKERSYKGWLLAKVERDLGWTSGDIQVIGEGGEPTPIGGLGPLEPQGRSVDLGSAAVTLRPTYAEVLARLEAVEQALAELRDRQLDDPSAPAQP